MNRRHFITNAGLAGVALSTLPLANALEKTNHFTGANDRPLAAMDNKLTPPAKGTIPVAVVISTGATVIDFAGPWEVFQDVMLADEQMPFQLFTVSDTLEPIVGSGGLKLVPDYTLETAPAPKLIVVGAQRGSEAIHNWLRKTAPSTDLTMSVCTGAFQLGKAGLLSRKTATTHHDFYDAFAKQFPDVTVKRGVRFVEGDKISTAGGLSSGIDLALRVVERYYGREIAQKTATYMEYQSQGWIV